VATRKSRQFRKAGEGTYKRKTARDEGKLRSVKF
jgi:hypothetical protein